MRSVEELRQEIETRRSDLLKNGDIVEKMKERAFYVPFMAMGTSLLTLYVGMGMLGAMVGAQIGALWLQREYFKLDPEGKLLADLKAIGRELKELKSQEQ